MMPKPLRALICITLKSLLHFGAVAQDSWTCPETWKLVANASLAGGDIMAALEEARACSNASVTSVVSVACEAGTTIKVDGAISVAQGVELRIVGEGSNITSTTAATSTSTSATFSASKSSSTSSGRAVEPSVITTTNGNASIFYVEPGGTLRLTSLTIRGGRLGGRAVHAFGVGYDSIVAAENCSWEDLSAEDAGGAIHSAGGVVTMAGTNVFSNCSSAGDGGGGIYMLQASLVVSGNMLFEGCNTTVNDGGGMYLYLAKMTITPGNRAEFRDCHAAAKGGGLYMMNSRVNVTEASSLSFSGCATGDGDDGKGGGVCSYSSHLIVGADAEVTFSNNSSPFHNAGGMYGKATKVMTASGSVLRFVDNHAGRNGGGLDMRWENEDDLDDEDPDPYWLGVCLDLVDGATAIFEGNSAGDFGGGAHFAWGCGVYLKGTVSFERNAGIRAGALYVDKSEVLVAGNATFVENRAERWGGAIMILDSPAALSITGRVVAQTNSAGRSGGVVYAENAGMSVAVSSDQGAAGALWEGNSAGYDGGVFAIDGGVVMLEGGFASGNTAAQRGGFLFATGESVVEWVSGESSSNIAGSGGSLYISSSDVNVTDVRLVGDHTPSGGTVFLAGANARFVNTTHVASENQRGDFALHVDTGSVVSALYCSFDGWSGQGSIIVIQGEAVMDTCDFSGSLMGDIVRSTRGTTIRNAILGDMNYADVDYDPSAIFGEGVHTCATLPDERSCLSNGEDEACMDAENGMGVLCTAYVAGATGDKISLSGNDSTEADLVVANASSTTREDVYYPDQVTKDLLLRHPSAAAEAYSSAEEGDALLWELRLADGTAYGQPAMGDGEFTSVSSDNFTWMAMPVSGVLDAGAEVTIRLVGTPPLPPNPNIPSVVYNGEVSAAFRVVTRTAEAGSIVASAAVSFEMDFYFCAAGSYWNGYACVSCAEAMEDIEEGSGALECSMSGVTLDTLPLAKGYWRGNVTQTLVRPCVYAPACVGGRGNISYDNEPSAFASATAAVAATIYDDTRYCREGYRGPLCAICTGSYRRISGRQCLDCSGGWGLGAVVAAYAVIVLLPFALLALVLFLMIGPSVFVQIMRRMKHCCGCAKPAGVSEWALDDSPGKRGAGGGPPPTLAVGRNHQPTSGVNSTGSSPISSKKAAAKGLGARLLRSIPFQKLKILIVVWQILTQFSSLADISYPPSYERFLAFLDVFDFDISWPLKASCLIRDITFYERLLAVTLGPITALAFLLGTYFAAMRWHRGPTLLDAENRQLVVIRHASAALLVLFLVFSSVSTTVFSTFPCDYVEDLDVSLLRADYSISCDHPKHTYYRAYAGLMIVLYPIGIPVMFAYLLLNRRDKINPPLTTHPSPAPPLTGKRRAMSMTTDVPSISSPSEFRSRGSSRFVRRGVGTGACAPSATSFGDISTDALPRRGMGLKRESTGGWGERFRTIAKGEGEDEALKLAPSVESKREEVLEQRAKDPDLQPTRFLWEPYDPHNYYYETVECGRRCLLTGALVFVQPNTAGQVSGACVFAFLSLLAFERIRPHLSHTDAWMYRIGCVVIFFSNFLGLMAKAKISEEDAQSQEIFGIVLIGVHASMVIAIIAQAFFSMQAMADSRDDLVETLITTPSTDDILARTNTGSDQRGKRAVSAETFTSDRRDEVGDDFNDDGGHRDLNRGRYSFPGPIDERESKSLEMCTVRYNIDPHDLVLMDDVPSHHGNARVGGLRHAGVPKTGTAAASLVNSGGDANDDKDTGNSNGVPHNDRVCESSSALQQYRDFDTEEVGSRTVIHPRTAHVLRQRAQKRAAAAAAAPASPTIASAEAAFVGQGDSNTGHVEHISQVDGGIRDEGEGHGRRDNQLSPPDEGYESPAEAALSTALTLPRLSARAVSAHTGLYNYLPSASSVNSRLSGSLLAFEREPRVGVEQSAPVSGDSGSDTDPISRTYVVPL